MFMFGCVSRVVKVREGVKNMYVQFLVFLGGVQTIFKVFRGGQGHFIDSREGLEKIKKEVPK